jgi:galactokinase
VTSDTGALARAAHPGATRVARAPGRVNLLGGHVDYHEGPVICAAIDRDVAIAFAPNDDGRIRLRSLDLPGAVDIATDGSAEPAAVTPAWGRLVGGVARSLAYGGTVLTGIDGVVASNVAIGGGLSSSAAFEVAVATALVDAASASLGGLDLALACQSAEHIANGVPCGIQDQVAAVCGVREHALLLDCRTLVVETLPLPTDAALVVVDSAVPRTLEGSPWPQRRAEGVACAERLGLRVLRDATPEQVADDPRGRHVVSEMQRVWRLADALRAADLDAAGRLMTAGHASLRDDMEVSIPELDVIVEELLAAGAYGARLTGGGFGGCCIGLAPAARADDIARAVEARYATRTGRPGRAFVAQAASGASVTDA